MKSKNFPLRASFAFDYPLRGAKAKAKGNKRAGGPYPRAYMKKMQIFYIKFSLFLVGAVYHRPDRKISVYRVSNANYLNDVIIPHFTKYPLISKKAIDFLL